MKVPNRAPDYEKSNWAIWFDEMILYGRSPYDRTLEKSIYLLEERHEQLWIIQFRSYTGELRDTQLTNDLMVEAYKQWQIERILLRD